MSKVFLFASLTVFATLGLLLAGCSQQPSSSQPATSPAASPANSPDPSPAMGQMAHEGHAMGEGGSMERAGHADAGAYADELAQLSAADRALAERQQVCPVSGQPLGAMGTPYKVTVRGRDVLLCCPGCEAKVQADPDKYLAKLPQ